MEAVFIGAQVSGCSADLKGSGLDRNSGLGEDSGQLLDQCGVIPIVDTQSGERR